MGLVSFSLFGPDRIYSVGAIRNADLCAELYPGWVCRFHVGASVHVGDLAELAGRPNVELVPMPDPEDNTALFWRFESLRDDGPEHQLFRDTDCRPCAREAAAVAEWLDSGVDFHVMRDHPLHWVAMLAGLWGCTRAGARRVRDLLPRPRPDAPWADQWWLRDRVYPVARLSMLVHDPLGLMRHETPRDFPHLPLPGRFVGQGFTAFDTPRFPEHAPA